MRKAIILVNAYALSPLTRQVERLSDELNKRGVTVVAYRNDGLRAAIENGKTTVDHTADFCIYLDKDKYIARMLEKSGMRLFNSAQAIENCDDKMLTHILLADNGVAMPDTIPGLLCYNDGEQLNEVALDKIEKRLGLPVVIKLSYGSMGKGVFLAKTRTELSATAKKLQLYPHLYQKYISSSHGKDMRVIVVGGKVIGGMIRSSDNGDFRSNIGLGGHAQKVDVPSEIKKAAIKAAKILELDYCGIDFLLGEKPLLCEVNSNAFFDAFEEATNINVAGAYADHILKEVYK
ncbi:MAG: RimK family alpha-L-glutamate ligase [Clostridiales bacterium]|nr:RimK family alpha-L-glutamate ligase [Clostridiales bacterium]